MAVFSGLFLRYNGGVFGPAFWGPVECSVPSRRFCALFSVSGVLHKMIVSLDQPSRSGDLNSLAVSHSRKAHTQRFFYRTVLGG